MKKYIKTAITSFILSFFLTGVLLAGFYLSTQTDSGSKHTIGKMLSDDGDD